LSRKIAVATVALTALVLAAVPASLAGGAKPVKKTVKVGDNFFDPPSLKVPKDSKITWRWPKNPGDVHDVKLRSGPKGVKKFHSELAASGYNFARTLKKPGEYLIVCTIHQEMDMTIKVKR
jgi:plastocyanin